jgi:PAS domain S-box-containing protein
MQDEDKTREQLIAELHELRERVAELEKDKATYKRAEEMLRRTEENFRRSLEESPLGVRIVTIEGETIYANRAILNIYGYDSIDDLKTTPAKNRYTPESYAEFQIRREIRKQGDYDPSEYEISIVRRDGEVRHLRVVRKDILWDSERQFQVIYQDITERKRMEEKLRTASLYTRSLIEASLDPFVTISPGGKITDVNRATEQVTGVSRERLIGDDFSNYFTEPEKARDGYQKVLVDGWLRDYQLTIRHTSGKTTDVLYNATVYRNELGEMQGVFAAARDITERKRAEQALQESSQKLKLFAYSVAHDLKSPAIGVYGLTKRLSKHAKDVLDEKGSNYCDQILKLSEHIAALVDKINVYIATKEGRLSIETINIADILHMLKDEFSARLSIRQIDWLKPETRIEIKADRLCMLRAFRNFLDNSLKYGGERLSKIWTGYEELEDSHIFSFSDDGKGLKEEDSERIFGVFQRNETSKGVEGAGLGLTIVKEIAEQHGGKVWVEPRSKRGITFYLSISKNLG